MNAPLQIVMHKQMYLSPHSVSTLVFKGYVMTSETTPVAPKVKG